MANLVPICILGHQPDVSSLMHTRIPADQWRRRFGLGEFELRFSSHGGRRETWWHTTRALTSRSAQLLRALDVPVRVAVRVAVRVHVH